MKAFKISPTKKSPLVELKSGEMRFAGCSIINDPHMFFEPVKEWLEQYLLDPSPATVIDIDFEYIDSASVKVFYDTLKILEPLAKDYKLLVNWHFDDGDPEILELGEIMQSKLKMEFIFVQKD